jgi:uncharacterized RDD family membrane protein YckC
VIDGPGKMVLGLKVIDADSQQTPPPPGKALRRGITALLLLVPLAGFLFGLVAFILSLVWMNSDPQRRSMHDRFADTRVVKVPK